jgi:hypothetical protein
MKTLRTTLILAAAAGALSLGCRDMNRSEHSRYSETPGSTTGEPVVGKKIEPPAPQPQSNGTGGSGDQGLSKCGNVQDTDANGTTCEQVNP